MTADTVDEAGRLAALVELEVLGTAPEERFDRITRLCTRLFGVPMAAVTLVAEDTHWVKSGAGVAVATTPRAQSFCDTTIRRPETLVVTDLSADDRFRDNPYVVADPGVRFYAGHPLEAPGGHRVGALCLMDDKPRELSEADASLLRDLAQWVQKELVIDEELQRAAEVQRGLIPTQLPRVDGWDVAGDCRPARDVGGDLVDWYDVPAGLVMTLADVMGKGMPAAIMAATVRAVMRGVTKHAGLVGAVEAAADSMARDFTESGAFATVFHSCLDPDSGVVGYVDAGHGLGVVVRADGSVERTTARGLPVGAVAETTWTEASVQLERGDVLVLVSDGLLDVLGSQAAVEGLALQAARCETASDGVALLAARAGGPHQPDDITALVLRRCA